MQKLSRLNEIARTTRTDPRKIAEEALDLIKELNIQPHTINDYLTPALEAHASYDTNPDDYVSLVNQSRKEAGLHAIGKEDVRYHLGRLIDSETARFDLLAGRQPQNFIGYAPGYAKELGIKPRVIPDLKKTVFFAYAKKAFEEKQPSDLQKAA